MIIPDKFTPPEKSLLFKAMLAIHKQTLKSELTNDTIYYDESIYKDIDEFIKVQTLIFILDINTSIKENTSNDSSD